jgi:hypothetical protein
MHARQILFIGFTELSKSLYKRFFQSGYACSFLTIDADGDVCELANRMFFSILNPATIQEQELILFSDTDPKLVWNYIQHVFKNKKVFFISYFDFGKKGSSWSKGFLKDLENNEVFFIRAFGNYSKVRLEDGSLYFHSETIFCTSNSEIAQKFQKLLFSIGIKAFYAGPLDNEKMIHAISNLEEAIKNYDKMNHNPFLKILGSH